MSMATIMVPGAVRKPPYILEENFEGTGFENTWTIEGGGTVDPDYTGVVLNGSQSLRVASTNVAMARARHDFPSGPYSELWGYFRLQMIALPSTTRQFFRLRDGSATVVFTLQVTSGGMIGVVAGGTGGNTVSAVTAGNTFNFWWHWKKGTGSNAIGSVGFSADGSLVEVTSGNGFHQRSAGTATTDAAEMHFGNTANGANEFVVDKVRVLATGAVGNYPR